MIYKQAKPIISLGQRCKKPGMLFKPHGVTINEQNTILYVAEGVGVSRISIFSSNGDFVTCFSHQNMICPWGIAINTDNIYVTDMDGDMLFNFEQDGPLCRVNVVGSNGRGDYEFKGPTQLAVSSSRDVYIADVWNNRVKVLSSNLTFVRDITHPSVTQPIDVKLLPNELYILSCEDSLCVHVLSYTGELLRSLISQGFGEQVSGADSFCVDSYNNVFISDWGSHQVKVFSDGTLVQTIGEEGHEEGEFWYPYGVVVTLDSHIIVVSLNRNNTLQIFKM